MLRDNGGVPASQLECDGRQLFGGLRRDDLADVLGPSIEDLVPLLIKQRCRLGDGTLYDRVARGVERLGDDFLEDGRSVGCRLGGLDDGGATCCDGANEGANGELEGEVVCSACLLLASCLHFPARTRSFHMCHNERI